MAESIERKSLMEVRKEALKLGKEMELSGSALNNFAAEAVAAEEKVMQLEFENTKLKN